MDVHYMDNSLYAPDNTYHIANVVPLCCDLHPPGKGFPLGFDGCRGQALKLGEETCGIVNIPVHPKGD